MCQLRQINFYHNCGHTQTLRAASLNPACSKLKHGVSYLEHQWCPKCTPLGFLVPFTYTEIGPGVACSGHTGDTSRVVKIAHENFGNYSTDQLWELREIFIKGPLQKFRDWKEVRYYKDLDRQQRTEKVDASDFVFYMRRPDPSREGFNRCEDLIYVLFKEDMPEETELCSICQHPLDWPEMEDEFAIVGAAANAESCNSLRAARLHCGHYFGEQCLGDWLAENDRCPVCNYEYKIERQSVEPEYWWPEEYDNELLFDYCSWWLKKGVYLDVMLYFWKEVVWAGVGFGLPLWTSYTNLLTLTLGALLYYTTSVHRPFVGLEVLHHATYPFTSAVLVGNLFEISWAVIFGTVYRLWVVMIFTPAMAFVVSNTAFGGRRLDVQELARVFGWMQIVSQVGAALFWFVRSYGLPWVLQLWDWGLQVSVR